jgi:hypothetical protein
MELSELHRGGMVRDASEAHCGHCGAGPDQYDAPAALGNGFIAA